jgi:hypothetical protein
MLKDEDDELVFDEITFEVYGESSVGKSSLQPSLVESQVESILTIPKLNDFQYIHDLDPDIVISR